MSVLERGKAVEILLALLERPMHFTELQSKVGGSLSTVQQRIAELLGDGLVIQKEEKKWPFKRTLQLTEKGVSTARYLQGLGSVTKSGVPKEREKWILGLLHSFTEVKGSTRLEKLIFLLKGDLKVSDYRYTWYKHGPYSPEVLEDARELAKLGLLEVKEEVFDKREGGEDYEMRVDYSLTPAGETLAAKLFDKLSERERRAILRLRKYNMAPLGMLLRYIYSEFSPKDLEREPE
jgi:DNA-binding HxlR family transcriptional regulator